MPPQPTLVYGALARIAGLGKDHQRIDARKRTKGRIFTAAAQCHTGRKPSWRAARHVSMPSPGLRPIGRNRRIIPSGTDSRWLAEKVIFEVPLRDPGPFGIETKRRPST